jgi:hemoglobin-like flavoprotein
MVEDEIKIIKETWQDIAKRPGADIEMLLYNRLFEHVPALPPSFQHDLRGHCKKFIVMHNYIINKLDNANFIHDVRSLGKKYSNDGIREEHFEQIKQALLWALKNKLKDEWTPSVMVSWVWYFSMLDCILKDSKKI